MYRHHTDFKSGPTHITLGGSIRNERDKIMANEVENAVATAADAAEAAAGKLDRVKADIKAQADKAIGKAKDAASTAYDKAAAKAKELKDVAPEKAREVKERAQKVAEEGTAKVRTTVQEQPLAALGAGIALGFVVGWLLSGRRND
jgi:ElaB/YqjD/DUF883 family membrane-anchored ribosome-binding protein